MFLRLLTPDLVFVELGSVNFLVAEGLFGAREALVDFLAAVVDLMLFISVVANGRDGAETFCLGAVCSWGEVGISCSPSMS